MDLSQVEKVIRDRIVELKDLEAREHMLRVRTSLQDKRDELEGLLLRLRAMAAISGVVPAKASSRSP